MKIIRFLFIIGLSFSNTTFNILDFPSNARSHSLHNGGVASSSKFLGINPASISIIKNQMEINFLQLPADIQYSGFSFCFLYKKNIFFSKFNYINYGHLKDDIENIKFRAHDFSFEFGYKLEYKNLFSVGYSIGYISSRIYSFMASGYYTNFGIRMNLINDRCAIGTSLNHAGFQTNSFGDQNESLPTTLRYGISYKPLYLPVFIFCDNIKYINNNNRKIQLGMDFKINEKFNLRISTTNNRQDLNTNQYYNDFLNNFSYGLGVKIKNKNINFSIQNIGPAGTTYGFSILI